MIAPKEKVCWSVTGLDQSDGEDDGFFFWSGFPCLIISAGWGMWCISEVYTRRNISRSLVSVERFLQGLLSKRVLTLNRSREKKYYVCHSLKNILQPAFHVFFLVPRESTSQTALEIDRQIQRAKIKRPYLLQGEAIPNQNSIRMGSSSVVMVWIFIALIGAAKPRPRVER